MEIIPVLDIKDGMVVQANGSARADYPPLKSVLTPHTALQAVTHDILQAHPNVQRVYLADLTALEAGTLDVDLYHQLVQAFPKIEFWLDAGIATWTDWEHVAELGMTAVIGTETLRDKDLLADEHVRSHSILSLDFKDGTLLGAAYLPPVAIWPDKVILMALNTIGTHSGPDLSLLSQMKKTAERQWFVAGGVRDKDDIIQSTTMGAAGILVGTALHSGKLSHQNTGRKK